MVYNITFDIDQTLAFHSVNSMAQGNFILEKGAILSDETLNTHYIYPGAIELVKLLFCSEEFKVSFYSKGTTLRNREFVRLFLDQAIKESEFELKKSDVRVLSREDLAIGDCDHCRQSQFNKYGVWAGEYQKNLFGVLSGDERIENAALIDDRAENAAFDQVPNYIYIPIVERHDFHALLDKKEFYDSTGERFLKCMMNFTKDADLEQDLVADGRRIIIYKTDDSFEIKFLDARGICHSKQVDKESNLFSKLNMCYEKHVVDGYYFDDIEDQGTVKSICEFVASYEGRFSKICRRANRICYVTGLLFTAISDAKELGISLSEALLQYQFTLKEDGESYRPKFTTLVKDDRFYRLGLEKLREINPDFEFVTPHSYSAHIQTPISNQVRQFLEYAKANEFK